MSSFVVTQLTKVSDVLNPFQKLYLDSQAGRRTGKDTMTTIWMWIVNNNALEGYKNENFCDYNKKTVREEINFLAAFLRNQYFRPCSFAHKYLWPNSNRNVPQETYQRKSIEYRIGLISGFLWPKRQKRRACDKKVPSTEEARHWRVFSTRKVKEHCCQLEKSLYLGLLSTTNEVQFSGQIRSLMLVAKIFLSLMMSI